MKNDELLTPNPPAKPGGRLKFLWLALGPTPVALLVFTSGLFVRPSMNGNEVGNLLIIFALAAATCCILGTIGLLGGFEKNAGVGTALGGIVLGIVLFVVEVLVTAYVGCAILIVHH